jgi:hypothetical protein
VISNEHGESDVIPTESKTTRTVGNFPRGSRETPKTSTVPKTADRLEKARCRTSDMHVAGESDGFIVPEKRANKVGVPPTAESVEGRGPTEENAEQLLRDRTPRRTSRSRGLLGVRESTRSRSVALTSTSKVRAVCGSSARTDLCGGWPERAIPTAIVSLRQVRPVRRAHGRQAHHWQAQAREVRSENLQIENELDFNRWRSTSDGRRRISRANAWHTWHSWHPDKIPREIYVFFRVPSECQWHS